MKSLRAQCVLALALTLGTLPRPGWADCRYASGNPSGWDQATCEQARRNYLNASSHLGGGGAGPCVCDGGGAGSGSGYVPTLNPGQQALMQGAQTLGNAAGPALFNKLFGPKQVPRQRAPDINRQLEWQRQQAELERQRREKAEAEEKQRKFGADKDALLGEMKGISSDSGDLGFKDVDTTSDIGFKQTTPLLRGGKIGKSMTPAVDPDKYVREMTEASSRYGQLQGEFEGKREAESAQSLQDKAGRWLAGAYYEEGKARAERLINDNVPGVAGLMERVKMGEEASQIVSDFALDKTFGNFKEMALAGAQGDAGAVEKGWSNITAANKTLNENVDKLAWKPFGGDPTEALKAAGRPAGEQAAGALQASGRTVTDKVKGFFVSRPYDTLEDLITSRLAVNAGDSPSIHRYSHPDEFRWPSRHR